MRKSKTDAEDGTDTTIITYKTLTALKTAKSRKTAPRGLKFRIDGNTVQFVIPSQKTPVLTVTVNEIVESSLKSDGFRPAAED